MSRRILPPLALALLASCALSSAAYADYESEVLADNPLVYYRFEDGGGFDAINSGSLGASHNGFFDRSVGFETGPLTADATNQAVDLSFDRAAVILNDVITVDQFAGAGATSFSSYTVEMWYRSLTNFTESNSLVAGTILDGSAHGIYAQLRAEHHLRYLHRQPPGTGGGENIDPSDQTGTRFQWHHVAFVNEGGAMSLYHDGNLDVVGNFASAPFDFDMFFAFGRLSATLDQRHFAGLMDEIAIYDHGLSASRVQAHFSAAPPQSPIIPDGTPDPGFGVDYGQADQFLQPDFIEESLNGSSGPQSVTTTGSNPFGGGGDLSVTVSESVGTGVFGLEYRNRNQNSSATIENVINDLVATRDGKLEVTISGLPEGDYEWTSWHHDPGGFASSGNTYEARLNGNNVAFFIPSLAAGFVGDDDVATANFLIQAVAGEDVVIEFETLNDFDPDAVGFFPMNGFMINGDVVVVEFEADFDGDGDVDGDDFLRWQGGFGTASGAGKMDGDYDNDGDVDGDDFLGWQGEFGSVAGDGSAAVPEPASAMLLIVGCIAVLRRFRR